MRVQRFTKNLMASLVLAIFVSAPATAQMEDNQAMMNLVIQVQQLQDEVRMLRGMLEEQTMELETLSNRQRDQYLDLDQRITGLRGLPPGPALQGAGLAAGDVTTGGITTAGANDMPADTGPAIREDVPEVRPALDTPSSVTAIATPNTQAREVIATPEMEKAAYDRAFQSLKELKYADAAEQFSTFVMQFPNSEYADNAQYWLGESYYVTRNYDIALEAFQQLMSNYPDSPKIPDGLLKIGYTHYELKQWDQARAALTQVQEQYPDTTLARLAGSRLRSMKLEGHF
jgi:tol-pal system protein YbgF